MTVFGVCRKSLSHRSQVSIRSHKSSTRSKKKRKFRRKKLEKTRIYDSLVLSRSRTLKIHCNLNFEIQTFTPIKIEDLSQLRKVQFSLCYWWDVWAGTRRKSEKCCHIFLLTSKVENILSFILSCFASSSSCTCVCKEYDNKYLSHPTIKRRKGLKWDETSSIFSAPCHDEMSVCVWKSSSIFTVDSITVSLYASNISPQFIHSKTPLLDASFSCCCRSDSNEIFSEGWKFAMYWSAHNLNQIRMESEKFSSFYGVMNFWHDFLWLWTVRSTCVSQWIWLIFASGIQFSKKNQPVKPKIGDWWGPQKISHKNFIKFQLNRTKHEIFCIEDLLNLKNKSVLDYESENFQFSKRIFHALYSPQTEPNSR